MRRTTKSWIALLFFGSLQAFAGDMTKDFICSDKQPSEVIAINDNAVILLRFRFSPDHYDLALHMPDQPPGAYTYYKSYEVQRRGEDDVIIKGLSEKKVSIEIRARELNLINTYGTLDGLASLRVDGVLLHPDLSCEYSRINSPSGNR